MSDVPRIRALAALFAFPLLYACGTTSPGGFLGRPYSDWTPWVNEDFCAITIDQRQHKKVGEHSVGASLSFGVRHANSRSNALAPITIESGEIVFWIQILPSIFLEDIVEISEVTIRAHGTDIVPTLINSEHSDIVPIFAISGDAAEAMWNGIVAGGQISYSYLLNPSTPISATVDGGRMIDAAAAMFEACVDTQNGR